MAMENKRTKDKNIIEDGNPKLMQRLMANGRYSLYLEYYEGSERRIKTDSEGKPVFYTEGKMAGKPVYVIHHERRKMKLNAPDMFLYKSPRTPEERQHNKDTKDIARRARFLAEMERADNPHKVTKRVDNLVAYFEDYVQDYSKKDVRNIRLAVSRFKTFLREKYPTCAVRRSAAEVAVIEEEWKQKHKGVYGRHEINENEFYRFYLKPSRLNKEMVTEFVAYLSANSEGSGAQTAYKRFKKIVKFAVSEGVLRTNPCDGITCVYDDYALVKDVLSADEVSKLLQTHYPGENSEIRRAFTFSLYTGIRFCDVKDLTFSNVDYPNKTLTFEQEKTKGHSKYSSVTIPLREDLLSLIGTPEKFGRGKDDRIFQLPSHTMCLKALRHWTEKAGIEKHVTWHVARHTFATLVLEGGANIRVVADLLGHSGLNYIQRYTRARDEKKVAAVNSLPKIV